MRALSFFLPFVVVLVFVPALRLLAPDLGLLDRPNARKHHEGAVPLVGGIAMFAAFIMASLTLGLLTEMPWGFFLGAAIVMILGMADDRHSLGSTLRFLVQALAVWLAITTSGNLITDLGELVGPWWIPLGMLSVPFTVFGYMGVINAVNLSDGADGMAGGIALTALAWFIVVFTLLREDGAWVAGSVDYVRVLLAMCGAVLGFLAYNLRTPWRKRASVFMGDAGSLFLGFVLGWFAIWSASQMGARDLYPVSTLWILIVPIFDTVSCMLRRVLQGRSPMSPDRQHAHHLLQAWGLSHGKAVAALIAVNALGGLVGVVGWRLRWPEYAMFGSIAACFVVYLAVSLRTWMRAPVPATARAAGSRIAP